MKKDILNSSFVIDNSSSIEEAMGAITDNQRGSVIVVNENNVFEGVISDGDIRRAMLQGATRMAPISKFVNMNATVITEKDAKEGKGNHVFESHSDINIIPVLNEKNNLIDVLIRDPKKRK